MSDLLFATFRLRDGRRHIGVRVHGAGGLLHEEDLDRLRTIVRNQTWPKIRIYLRHDPIGREPDVTVDVPVTDILSIDVEDRTLSEVLASVGVSKRRVGARWAYERHGKTVLTGAPADAWAWLAETGGRVCDRGLRQEVVP